MLCTSDQAEGRGEERAVDWASRMFKVLSLSPVLRAVGISAVT